MLHRSMAYCTSLHTLADPSAAVGPRAATAFGKRLCPAVALRAQPSLCVCRPAASGRAEGSGCSSGAAAQHSTRRPCRGAGPAVLARHAAQGLGAWCVSALAGLEPAVAAVHAEPANALSLPTWAIHVSSTVEWGVAMYLVWQYAEVTGNERWKGLTWGMMPLLGGAMTACTYHFFYNSPSLDALVALQAGLTFLGNTTCAVAAFRIFKGSRASAGSS